MSESPPEFPVPGHQLPPAGSSHSASGGPNHQSPIMGEARYPATPGTNYQSPDDDEISLLDILIVLAKHKKLILGLPLVAAVITAGITLLMPNWYTATAKLLPPQQSQSNAVAILGQLGALSGGASSALGLKNPSDIFVVMLKSRTVADSIIERFNLKELYDEKYLQDTRKALSRNVDITAGREGVITLDVDDKDPNRAAEIANAYVEELEKLTRRLAVGEAGQRRLFFEQQLKQAKDDLTHAETELTKFQIEKKVLNPQGQASLTISAAAGLQAQIAAKEVQIAALRSFATQQNPDLIRTQEELSGLRTQLAKVARGKSEDIGDVLLSVGRAPQEGADYLRKFRDVKYYETLYELLAKQYEIARIDEAKDATLIQVLDKAVKPEKKSQPKRRIIVTVAVLISLIFILMWLVIYENIQRIRNEPLHARKIDLALKYLRSLS